MLFIFASRRFDRGLYDLGQYAIFLQIFSVTILAFLLYQTFFWSFYADRVLQKKIAL